MTEDWDGLSEPITLPSPVVRFHKVIKDDEIVDTLAVMANGQSVSLSALLGDGPPNA